MSTLTFPYRYKRIPLGRVVDPLVPLQIKASYGWQTVWILVDTGADTTTLPLRFARRMGIPFNQTKREKLSGIGNEVVWGYPAVVDLRINGYPLSVRTHLLETYQDILLLGRMDVFDKYTLIFDNHHQKLQFQEV